MLMLRDVFHTIAEPAACWAVTELPGGVRQVGDAADRTAVERFSFRSDLPCTCGHLAVTASHSPQNFPAEE